MNYRQLETVDAVILEPVTKAGAAIIWLHGLGADGHDFVPIVGELQLPGSPAVRFVFPHARVRPVTINAGMAMRAWYDIKALSAAGPEDEDGIRASEARVRELIGAQTDAGIAPDRVVIAGFSQGGAIALHTALCHPQRLGGVMALSTYLPLRDTLTAEAAAVNADLPVLMCHGSDDPVLPMQLGERSRDHLQALGYPVTWKPYRMQHQVCMQEIDDISAWLKALLADQGTSE